MSAEKRASPAPIDPDRRAFLRRLVAPAAGLLGADRAAYTFAETAALSREELERVVPVRGAASSARIEGDCLLASDGGESAKVIYRFEPQQLAILEAFDSQRSVDAIAAQVAGRLGVSRDDAFFEVRRVVLLLARWSIFVPTAPSDPSCS